MLDNFKNIYDEEIINGDYTTFETRILNSSSLRMFVYEVCKACATLQQAAGPDAEKTVL